MTGLPVTIEAYLIESGLSKTEILILKKLLEGPAYTVRELASRMGKSTGLLDRSVKKLVKRGVLKCETINDTTKYSVGSLQSIQAWMKADMEQKHKDLHRKERDFESFITALELDKSRPEIEYFEGADGITKAYGKLLTLAEKELLFYVPVNCKEEEDPLRDFRVRYFRARHKRGLFSRVLVPDTQLGKRYQSRDHFEYRKTILMPEAQFPVSFEKVIAEEVVACFNHKNQCACFLRYPELAESEKAMFEMIWDRAEEKEGEATKKEDEDKVAISTLTMSAIRDFFISRKSIAAFVVCAVLAATVTFGLYRQNVYLNTQRVRERVMAIAATAAPEFDAKDLDELRTEYDATKPEYKKVILKMREIREQNEGVVYMYILRPTDQENIFAFVADADSLDLDAKIDLNNDGVIDDADWLSPPGELYDDTEYATINIALEGPMADKYPVTDQWGTWLSGHAPIKDEYGNTNAIIGIDMNPYEVQKLSKETFKLFLYFLVFFLLFVFVRLAAFNRSLCKELFKLVNTKKVMITLGISSLIALGVTYGMYRYTLNIMKEEVGQRLMSIAATAAPEFDAKDLEVLRIAKDMEREEYQRVFVKLNEIINANTNIKYAYIMRKTSEFGIWEFIVDSTVNYDTDEVIDWNEDGLIDDADEAAPPGTRYDASGQQMDSFGLSRPTMEKELINDQWGVFLSATAPIYNEQGDSVAILGLDIDVVELIDMTYEKFSSYFVFLSVFLTLIIVRLTLIFLRFKTPSR
ncbi:MAG: hypothetical protein K9M03_03855 [Kiritimatiellales bacterium]|nr:hypothetical protein [Kiritimatiellales bacterium]